MTAEKAGWGLVVAINGLLMLIVVMWGVASLAKDAMAIIGIGIWMLWGIPVLAVGVNVLRSFSKPGGKHTTRDIFSAVPWVLLLLTGLAWYGFQSIE